MEDASPAAAIPFDTMEDALARRLQDAVVSQLGSTASLVGDAVSWTLAELGGASYNAISSGLAEIGAKVWLAFTGAFGWILKWSYSYMRGWLLPFVASQNQFRFAAPENIFGDDPLYMFGLIITLLGYVVADTVSGVGNWVLGQLRAGLGYVEHGFATVYDVVAWATGAAGNWVWDQVRAGLGAVAHGFASVYDLVAWATGAAANWLWGKIAAASGTVIDLAGGVVNPLTTVVNAAATWLWGKISSAAGVVIDLAGGVVNPLTTVVNNSANWLLGQIRTALGVVTGIPGQVITPVTSAVNASASWLLGQIQAGLAALPGLITGAIQAIPGIPGNIVDLIGARVTAGVQWLWGQIAAASGTVIDLAGRVVNPLTTVVNAAASWLWGNIQPLLLEISGAVISGAQQVFSGLFDIIRDALMWVFEHVAEPVAGEIATKMGQVRRFMTGGYETLDEAASALFEVHGPLLPHAAMLMLLPFVLGGAAISATGTMSALMGRPIVEAYNRKWHNAVPPLSVIQEGVRRKTIGAGMAREYVSRMGYPQDVADTIIEVVRNYPSLQQAIDLNHRGLLQPGQLDQLLTIYGIAPEWRSALTAVGNKTIGLRQIGRLYKAGVYTAGDVETALEHDGYSTYDAKQLTRSIVKLDEVVEPGTKGKLKVLSEAVVHQAYARRLITRPVAAGHLAELDYTTQETELILNIWDFDFSTNPDNRSDTKPKTLGRAVIEQAYERGLVDANRASHELEDLGYTPEDAALMLKIIDLKLHGQLADAEIQIVTEEYHAGLLTEAEMAARLTELHVPQRRIELIVQREQATRSVKTARLTLAQVLAAFKRDIVGKDELLQRLDALGYNRRDVEILFQLSAPAA